MAEQTPYSVAAAILAHVKDALLAAESAPITTEFVAAGQIAFDDCCGTLVVMPELVQESGYPFPSPRDPRLPCPQPMIQVDVLVLLVRCVPVLDDSGNPPTAAEQDAAFQAILRDAAIVWNALVVDTAVLGADPYGDPLWERANASQGMQAPSGGCIGIETRVSYGIPQDLWCIGGP